MTTFLGTTADFSKLQLSEKALQRSEYLYIEGYLVASPTACEAAIMASEMASKHGVKTALTLSDANMVTYFREGLNAIIGKQVDILFCNEHEALLFSQTDNLIEARRALKDVAKTFVITRGDEGALIYDGQDYIDIPAYEVLVKDTVGAGDVFAGTFMYGITHHFNYFEAGQLASFAASKVVAKFGPRLNQHEIHHVREMLTQLSPIPANA